MASVVAQESLKATVVTYIGVAVGFFTTFFVLTNYLTPEEVGLTRLLVEVATLLASLGLLGLSTSINRFFPYFYVAGSERGRGAVHHGFLRYALQIAALGSAIALPLYYWLREPIMTLYRQNSALFVDYYWWVVPLALLIVFWTVGELYSTQLMHLFIPKTIRELLLRLLLLASYLIYAWGDIDFEVFVGIFVAAYLVCMLASYLYLSRITRLSLRPDPEHLTPQLRRSFGRYTLLAVLSTVGTMLAGRMDLLLLALVDHQGLTSVAIFSIAFFMVSILEAPTRAIIGIATPRIAMMMKAGDLSGTKRIYEQVAFYQLLTSLIIFVIILANLDNILSIMPGGADYVDSKAVFLFLGIAKLVEVTFTGSHPIVSCSSYYHWHLYYTLSLILVALAANLLLIPLFGTMGAAMATLISVCLGYGLQQGLLQLRLRVHPLSRRLLAVLPVGLAMLAAHYFLPTIANPWLDTGLRSMTLGLVAVVVVAILRCTPEVKALLHVWITRLGSPR